MLLFSYFYIFCNYKFLFVFVWFLLGIFCFHCCCSVIQGWGAGLGQEQGHRVTVFLRNRGAKPRIPMVPAAVLWPELDVTQPDASHTVTVSLS